MNDDNFGVVPEQYFDCNKHDGAFRCTALEEKFCVTRGKCKFYKPKKRKGEEENEGD